MPAKFVVAVALSLLWSATAHGLTGNELYDKCVRQAGPKTTVTDVGCIAFIRGLIDGYQVGKMMNLSGMSMCEPQNLRADQARLIIEKYMKENPADLHLNAAAISLAALMVAYPCPTKSK